MEQKVTKVEDSIDFLEIMQYVMHCELGVMETRDGKDWLHRYGVAEYARLQGITRQAMWQKIGKWTKQGILQECRKQVLFAFNEEVVLANRRLLARWGEFADMMGNLAMTSKRDDVRFNAIAWIFDQVVKPAQEAQSEGGKQERDYLDMIEGENTVFQPLAIAD